MRTLSRSSRYEQRLELIAPELSGQLRHAEEQALRAAALTVCRFAIESTGLVSTTVNDGITGLLRHQYGSGALRKRVELQVTQLDDLQWQLQAAAERGEVDNEAYLAAFRRARAAHAVWFALDENPVIAVIEAMYEAYAATDDISALEALIRPLLA